MNNTSCSGMKPTHLNMLPLQSIFLSQDSLHLSPYLEEYKKNFSPFITK